MGVHFTLFQASCCPVVVVLSWTSNWTAACSVPSAGQYAAPLSSGKKGAENGMMQNDTSPSFDNQNQISQTMIALLPCNSELKRSIPWVCFSNILYSASALG